jgi:hypothetical protein
MPLVEAPRNEPPERALIGTTGRVAPMLGRSTWLGLVLFGVLLFGVGIYVGLGVTHALAEQLPDSPVVVALPYVFTVGGGALGMYAYGAYEQHPDGPAGDAEREAEASLRELPSFEIYRPPREGSP